MPTCDPNTDPAANEDAYYQWFNIWWASFALTLMARIVWSRDPRFKERASWPSLGRHQQMLGGVKILAGVVMLITMPCYSDSTDVCWPVLLLLTGGAWIHSGRKLRKLCETDLPSVVVRAQMAGVELDYSNTPLSNTGQPAQAQPPTTTGSYVPPVMPQ